MSVLELVESVKQMTDRDWKVLRTIELAMRNHEWVPVDEIVRRSKFDSNEVLYRYPLMVPHP